MPVIDGVKMACAPCIRGHRATRCNHAGERPLVQVRKPGRPLSSCSCIPGRPCSCGAGVKVALPRKKACKCEAEDGPATPSGIIKTEPFTPAITPASTPISPSAARPFRIEKPASVPGVSARKKSISVAQFEQMDPATFNLRPSIQREFPLLSHQIDMPAPAPRPLPVRVPYGVELPDDFSAQTSQQPILPIYNNGFPVESQFGLGQGIVTKPGTLMQEPGHNQSIHRTSISDKPNGSCCGSKQPQPVLQHHLQPLAPPTLPTPRKSCCGGGSETAQTSSNGTPSMQPTVTTHDMLSMLAPNPFPAGMPLDLLGSGQPILDGPFAGLHRGNPTPPFAPSNGTMHYPANIGTMAQPITPSFWAQLQAQQQFLLQQQDNGSSFTNGAPMQSLPVTNQAKDTGVSHDCTCGPDCGCLGCVSHPFNMQMYQYVNSANEDFDQTPTVLLGSDNNNPNGNGHYVKTEANLPTPPRMQGHDQDSQLPQHDAATPSDASGLSDEHQQYLAASDFFWIDVPVPCQGITNACPCGPDCACAGCIVHNNPLPNMPF